MSGMAMDPALVLEAAEVARHRVINETIARGDSPVQQFYAGAVVFITGGSGFLGKQLIEKLLRSCKIQKVIMLMRPKKKATIEERIRKIVEDPVYDVLRKMQPDFHQKIMPVIGDVTELNLGISPESWKDLTEQVTMIFHVAATINFTEPLRVATFTNVRGTREVLKLGKACKNLKSFVHVSTAFAHSTEKRAHQTVLEQFYESPMSPELLIQLAEELDTKSLDDMTAHIIQDWPNTYAFTKAVSEELVRTAAGDLPICIVRPAIVVAAYREPLPGWIDRNSAYGPTGLLLGCGLGVIHTFICRQDINLDLVPVDFVNNMIIIAARETVLRRERGETDIKIYSVTSSRNPRLFGNVLEALTEDSRHIITDKSVFYSFLVTTSNKFLFFILTWLFHLLPGYLVDDVLRLLGKQPFLVKNYKKIFKMSSVLGYFLVNAWSFSDSNAVETYSHLSSEDQIIYECNPATIHWKTFGKLWILGTRKYIIKDGLNRTAVGVKKQNWWRYVSVVIAVLYGLLLFTLFRYFFNTENRRCMGTMFRSEEMVLCQLFVQPEAAYISMYELGEAGVAQFRDLNPHVNDFQRRYVSEVRRCSEMERKLRWVGGELPEPPPPPKLSPHSLSPREINILEERIDFIESEIQEITRNARNLKADYLALKELKILIEKMQTFFQDHSAQRKISASVYNNEAVIAHLGFITGVVATARVPSFEKMLWRISHGNIFFKQAQIDVPLKDPVTGHELQKTVFVVFFHGEQIKMRVKKVCHGFKATLYPCPATYKEQLEMLQGVVTRIKDLEMVLAQTEQHRRLVLTNIAKDFNTWLVAVKKEKAIYHTLNMFSMDIVKKCLIAECWVPKGDLLIVQRALENGVKASGSPIPSFVHHVPTREVPPTFNRTNKFTKGFQNLIDSYGIASYREVNPALYTIVTFPFLFAVMFGDMGHGLILTIFAATLVILEEKFLKYRTDNEIWNIFFGGRYIILLMGIFSIYTGLIYNDIFSKSFNIFGSSWVNNYDNETLRRVKVLQLDPATDAYTRTPYPLGLDPAWQFAENNIIFLNSFKMKLSIIFGVIHMAFGVTMSVVNFNFLKKPEMIYLQYIPQILFLLLLFWYLCILMFLKWSLYSADPNEPVAYGTSCAPSVLILFINMMLLKKTEAKEPCQAFIFTGQDELQKTFLILAFLCIPVMLFGKPVYNTLMDKKRKQYQQGVESGDVVEVDKEHDGGKGEELITQAIHTIEYVLGTVSHTASYLRLWALSLAHAQLSAVLWQRVLKMGMGTSFASSVALYVIFAVWAFFTVAILVLMEGLSAFLHTLRLHWVEFMSKFYEGHGYAFMPFSFAAILENDDEDVKPLRNGAPPE